MKKKILLISVVCVVTVLLIAFILVNFGKDSDKFKIRLKGVLPYEWKYSISNDNVEFVKNESKSICKGCFNSGFDKYYIFKAIKPGTTEIIFEYRKWDDNTVEEKRIYKVYYNGWLKPFVRRVK